MARDVSDRTMHVLIGVLLLCLLFAIVALAVPFWSTGEATKDNSTGDINIGLWMACARVDGETIFSPLNNDCRLGHCIAFDTFTSATQWSNHGLCRRGKTSAVFAIFTAMCIFLAIWHTLVRRLRNLEENLGWATFFTWFSTLTTLISWSVWVSWQADMNDDGDRNVAGNIVNFSKLELGAGCVLTIVLFVFTLIEGLALFKLFRHSQRQRRAETARARQQRQKPVPARPAAQNKLHADAADDEGRNTTTGRPVSMHLAPQGDTSA